MQHNLQFGRVETAFCPKDYPTCARPVQERKKWVVRGCTQWEVCPWHDNLEYMLPRDKTDDAPRPRNVRTKFIKPNPGGPGDRVMNNYCSCFRFLGGLKRRDGRNNEIAEATGGEGDTVNLKGSERVVNPDNTIYFKPKIVETTIPRFPDPTEVDELFEDVYAGKDRVDHRSRTVDADRQRRLGMVSADEHRAASEGIEEVVIDVNEIKARHARAG